MSYQKNAFFVHKCFFHRLFSFFLFYYAFFMTGAGRYAPALGSDTLHERTLLEFTVHVFYESKMIFYRKACSNIKLFFSVARYPAS